MDSNDLLTRRRVLLGGSLSLLAVSTSAYRGCAEDAGLFPFKDDQGRPVFNYRLPAELSIDGVPGVIWTGSTAPTAILAEFFDYNCAYCRAAAKDIDGLLRSDRALKLGLVNNPILGLGSMQAAKVQQAVLRSFGPEKAYAFHLELLDSHRPVDGPAALQAASDLGLDPKLIATSADLPRIGEVLKRQYTLAADLGLDATPSFVIDGIAIPGYPGAKALASAVSATRTCDKLVC
jgi:protein-disulfide isomerase